MVYRLRSGRSNHYAIGSVAEVATLLSLLNGKIAFYLPITDNDALHVIRIWF